MRDAGDFLSFLSARTFRATGCHFDVLSPFTSSSFGRLGGNSAKASSGMNAALSKPQLEQKIEDKLEDFNSDIIK